MGSCLVSEVAPVSRFEFAAAAVVTFEVVAAAVTFEVDAGFAAAAVRVAVAIELSADLVGVVSVYSRQPQDQADETF